MIITRESLDIRKFVTKKYKGFEGLLGSVVTLNCGMGAVLIEEADIELKISKINDYLNAGECVGFELASLYNIEESKHLEISCDKFVKDKKVPLVKWDSRAEIKEFNKEVSNSVVFDFYALGRSTKSVEMYEDLLEAIFPGGYGGSFMLQVTKKDGIYLMELIGCTEECEIFTIEDWVFESTYIGKELLSLVKVCI